VDLDINDRNSAINWEEACYRKYGYPIDQDNPTELEESGKVRKQGTAYHEFHGFQIDSGEGT
jgi:hypothetical protein